MNESSSAASAAGQGDPSTAKLEFADRVAHLKAGYDNSQAVVRFLDTKASAVIAVIPIVIAALAAVFGVVKDWVQWNAALASGYTYAMWSLVAVTIVAAVALLALGKLAIISAFAAIMPRDLGTAKPSVLFPFAGTYPLPRPDDSFTSRVAFIKTGSTQFDVLEDYERQIIRMSEIVAEKVKSVNAAVKHLERFFITALVLLALICATTIVGAFAV